MPDEIKSWWQRLSSAVDLLAKIAIPVVIFVVGQQYTLQKDNSDLAQRRIDRVAGLLKSLASKDTQEQLLTIRYIDYLREQKELPDELYGALVVVQVTQGNSAVGKAASEVLESAQQSNQVTQEQVQKIAAKLPPTVYLQIADESQRAKAEELRTNLQSAGFIAPGVELRPESPDKSELRYFNPDDQAATKQVTDIANASGVQLEVKDASKIVKNRKAPPPRQVEVWLGKRINAERVP